MKEEYFKKIVEQLKMCDDISLLDFIYHLLKKQTAEI